MHDRMVALAQRGIESRVLPDLRFRRRAGGNVADIALDDFDAFEIIGIGYDFNADRRPRLRSEREIFISDEAGSLQFREHLLAFRPIGKQTNIPYFFSEKLRLFFEKHIFGDVVHHFQ